MLFSEIRDFKSLTFTVTIYIHKIVLEEDDRILSEPNSTSISAKPQRIQWIVNESLLRSVQRAHIGKYFESEMYDGIWCLRIKRASSRYVVFLQICAFPADTECVTVQYKIECILKQKWNDKKVTDSMTKSFDVNNSNWSLIWRQDDLPVKDVQKCELLMVNLVITPQLTDDSKYVHLCRALRV